MNATLNLETVEAVSTYLRETGRVSAQEQFSVYPLEGGVSSRTFWIERGNGEAWVLKQAREKLKVAVDWFCRPDRSQREALGIRWLPNLAPKDTIPPLVFEDAERHLLAMRAVPKPHENWKTRLLRGEVERDLVEQFGRILGTIHRTSYLQREELAIVFADRSYFEDLRLEPYYQYTAKQVPEAKVFLEDLIRDTRSIQIAIVHGDYSPKNILIYQGKIWLVDHEVIHWGDPTFDLGFSLTHFLSKAHHLPMHRETFGEAANLYWKTYIAAMEGNCLDEEYERRAARHTLACLLARVAGRSCLEYLDTSEREIQKQAVVMMLPRCPETIPELIRKFLENIHLCR